MSGLWAWLTWRVLLMSFWVAADDSVELDELLAGAVAAAPVVRDHV